MTNSPGMLTFIYLPKSGNHIIRLKILLMEDGSVLKSFNYRHHRKRKVVELVELCNGKLFVKQENEKLQILDVCILSPLL